MCSAGILHCSEPGLPPRIPDHRRHPRHRPRARRAAGRARHRAAAARGPRSGAGEPDRRRDRSRHAGSIRCARPSRPMPGTAGPISTRRRPIRRDGVQPGAARAAWRGCWKWRAARRLGRVIDLGCGAGRTAVRPGRTPSGRSGAGRRYQSRPAAPGPPGACRHASPIRAGASASCMTGGASRSPCLAPNGWISGPATRSPCPSPPGSADLAAALNLLDCVSEPRGCWRVSPKWCGPTAGCCSPTPYDWSTRATQVETWIGGHSQRAAHAGAAEPFLRALLTEGAHPQSVAGLHAAGGEQAWPWQTAARAQRSAVSDSSAGVLDAPHRPEIALRATARRQAAHADTRPMPTSTGESDQRPDNVTTEAVASTMPSSSAAAALSKYGRARARPRAPPRRPRTRRDRGLAVLASVS